MQQLPLELLHIIFRFSVTGSKSTLCHLFFRKFGDEVEPEEPQVSRTWNALQSVCMLWRDLTIEYFYERVEIRDICRLVQLVDCLRADKSARSYGSYIKLIRLKFHVPSHWQGIYTRSLIRLFPFCSNLETFIINNSAQFLEVRPPCAIPDGVINASIPAIQDGKPCLISESAIYPSGW
jgi:hypothetical protein